MFWVSKVFLSLTFKPNIEKMKCLLFRQTPSYSDFHYRKHHHWYFSQKKIMMPFCFFFFQIFFFPILVFSRATSGSRSPTIQCCYSSWCPCSSTWGASAFSAIAWGFVKWVVVRIFRKFFFNIFRLGDEIRSNAKALFHWSPQQEVHFCLGIKFFIVLTKSETKKKNRTTYQDPRPLPIGSFIFWENLLGSEIS